MINNIGKSPTVSFPQSIPDPATSSFLTALVKDITTGFQTIANAINQIINQLNAVSPPGTAPLLLAVYIKTALPSAVDNPNTIIIVSNDVGGLTPAFSDGSNWRRTADRNIIS